MAPNQASHSVRLPQEILGLIVAHLIPSRPTPIALPQSHITTKTLVSLLYTSRALYAVALRPLYQHCLYINSTDRLLRLTITLCEYQEREAGYGFKNRLPHVAIIPHITSLYLSPGLNSDDRFSERDLIPSSNLLTIIAPTVKRLIWAFPTRSLQWQWGGGYQSFEAHGIRDILRSCLEPLKQLEVFCSVFDSMDVLMDFDERGHNVTTFRDIFSHWPKCRVLALYNTDLSHEIFWRSWNKMPALERLIATRSDEAHIDMVAYWDSLHSGEKRKLDVEMVNVEHRQRGLVGEANWKKEDAMQVREVIVPISYYGDEDEITLCQNWVLRCLLRGDETIEGCEPAPMMVM